MGPRRLTAGPQLLGHSVFNRLLPAVGATVVSVAVLLEVVGASAGVVVLGRGTPGAAIPAAALLLVGVGLVGADAPGAAEEAPGVP